MEVVYGIYETDNYGTFISPSTYFKDHLFWQYLFWYSTCDLVVLIYFWWFTIIKLFSQFKLVFFPKVFFFDLCFGIVSVYKLKSIDLWKYPKNIEKFPFLTSKFRYSNLPETCNKTDSELYETCSSPWLPVCSHYLVCSENYLSIVGIRLILDKEL